MLLTYSLVIFLTTGINDTTHYRFEGFSTRAACEEKGHEVAAAWHRPEVTMTSPLIEWSCNPKLEPMT